MPQFCFFPLSPFPLFCELTVKKVNDRTLKGWTSWLHVACSQSPRVISVPLSLYIVSCVSRLPITESSDNGFSVQMPWHGLNRGKMVCFLNKQVEINSVLDSLEKLPWTKDEELHEIITNPKDTNFAEMACIWNCFSWELGEHGKSARTWESR